MKLCKFQHDDIWRQLLFMSRDFAVVQELEHFNETWGYVTGSFILSKGNVHVLSLQILLFSWPQLQLISMPFCTDSTVLTVFWISIQKKFWTVPGYLVLYWYNLHQGSTWADLIPTGDVKTLLITDWLERIVSIIASLLWKTGRPEQTGHF